MFFRESEGTRFGLVGIILGYLRGAGEARQSRSRTSRICIYQSKQYTLIPPTYRQLVIRARSKFTTATQVSEQENGC